MQRLTCLIPIVFACIVAGCSRQAPQTASPADPVCLAVVNARVWTGDASRPWAEALAIPASRFRSISRLDGHMALANSAALRAAGITRSTKAIAGGEIVRSANGEPTGILKDNAMSLVDAVVPEPSAELKDRALAAAMKYVNEQGVTSVHNMGSWSDLDTFARAARASTPR